MEEQAEYQLATSDIGKLQAMQAVTWERNALVFNTRLDQSTIDELAGGLTKFTEGYQLFFADLWKMLEVSGYEWTDYVPDGIAFNTANNWRRMVQRFPVDVRLSHHHLKASHYIEANHRKLSDDQALQLLDHADKHEWTVEMVREAVREAIGKPERQEKPKVTTCPHCDQYVIEGEEPCPWCMLSVSDNRIEDLRERLTAMSACYPDPDIGVLETMIHLALTEV